jgi:hypothetical protein
MGKRSDNAKQLSIVGSRHLQLLDCQGLGCDQPHGLFFNPRNRVLMGLPVYYLALVCVVVGFVWLPLVLLRFAPYLERGSKRVAGYG